MGKVILVIRDGWGHSPKKEKNAIFSANTENTDRLMKQCPNTLLKCSGEAVGLEKGYQGNSEVGHLTIGSGRIIWQPMERINKAIETGEFFENRAFLKAIENCKKNGSRLHLIGLLQSEGVHAHERHLYALLELCKKQKFKGVLIHVVTDGRDAPVNDGVKHVKKLKAEMKRLGIGKIATLSGRYYAMDRDKRWDRTRRAYDCIVKGECEKEFGEIEKEILKCYKEKETDEFIKPRKAKGYDGIKENDSIIFYNFRTDRPRQLTQSIVEKEFPGWERKPLNVCYVAMTEYYKPMNAVAAFHDIKIENLLGEAISRAGLKQLRISETEKYAHVTFFFNGQVEQPFSGEERILVPSPKVATYDLKPEMSAFEVTEKLVQEIKKGKYGFIVVNLVNGDLVGHTGIWKACLKAAETVDKCLASIVQAGLEKDYTLLVFADHGNLEDQSRKWATSHTINDVPLILVSRDPKLEKAKLRKEAGLQDIAPTVLEIMGLEKPKEMTGKSLFC
ncbi:MAG: 2,3-bisphosphoglycerate-independent phosphoglycerate mutase [Candidatus Diapherotrites archaeon]|uniref:2,3-bisphosphoglycerate-independent phosphoglycerate mutase n=1 Tax=Candidatus Iainarchaeum sp. TaxID=3101447 RepID=A0A939CA85_9ARCH|nr:2,3-bisphosphoglycerate-independent phosphoglycerate mutase [Candidatus Diapherotrites archaeon]